MIISRIAQKFLRLQARFGTHGESDVARSAAWATMPWGRDRRGSRDGGCVDRSAGWTGAVVVGVPARADRRRADERARFPPGRSGRFANACFTERLPLARPSGADPGPDQIQAARPGSLGVAARERRNADRRATLRRPPRRRFLPARRCWPGRAVPVRSRQAPRWRRRGTSCGSRRAGHGP